MTESCLIFADTIGELLDWLVPVVFFGIFFLSVATNAKKKAKTTPTARSRTAPPTAARPRPRPRSAERPQPQYPRANGADAVLELQQQEVPVAEAVPTMVMEAEPVESFDVVEGESHVTPMGEPYRSSLAEATAPSIEHSEEHIGAAMPEGTVAPPPEGATVKAGAKVAVRRARVNTAATAPKLRLARGKAALRNAIVLREVLSRPRAYDI